MTRTRLEYNVQRKVKSEINKMFRESKSVPFPYDADSTLEEMGMVSMDAVAFISRLEDIYGVDFDKALTPLYEEADRKAREEAEEEKDSSWFAPEVPPQEMFMRVGEITDFIITEMQTREAA